MRHLQATRGAPLGDPGPPGGPGARRRRRLALLAAVALTVFGADLATKTAVVAHLRDGRVIRLLGGALDLVQDRNPGAAFSLGTGATVVFTVVAVAVIAVIVRTAARLRSAGWAVALGLLLGGASGNLADRLFRSPGPLRGHVVDWLDFRVWPVFNLADAAIVCGGALAVLLTSRGIGVAGPVTEPAGEPPAGPASVDVARAGPPPRPPGGAG